MEKKITISKGDFSDKKILIATPMYGGQCSFNYFSSMYNFAEATVSLDIKSKISLVYNESLIQRARNLIVDNFLLSDCDYLIFVDGDIGFRVIDMLLLLYYAKNNEHMEIITGPYPKKGYKWENLLQDISNNKINNLEDIKQSLVMWPNFFSEKVTFDLTEPVEIQNGTTGFMLIKRSVFEKIEKHFPEKRYKTLRSVDAFYDRDFWHGNPKEGGFSTLWFDCFIDPETGLYLSEDYGFTYMAKKAGIKSWLIPAIELSHYGQHIFDGNFTESARRKGVEIEPLD